MKKIAFVLLAVPVLFLAACTNNSGTSDKSQTPESGPGPSPGLHEISSSRFGTKVSYPNANEGAAWSAWLSGGGYLDEDTGTDSGTDRGYNEMLANKSIARKITSVVDPVLAVIKDEHVDAYVFYESYNGLLTVRIHKIDKELAGGMWDGRYLVIDALHFDMHTGEQVDLRSVFADDFDAQKAVDKAVQSYVLAYDEENLHRFRGVDLQKTRFTLNTEGIWLTFDKESPFLSGQTHYFEWYRFGEGAIAVFDRFVPLGKSDIDKEYMKDLDTQGFHQTIIYRSEPMYMVIPNSFFFLPVTLENEYERELADKAKQVIHKSRPGEDGLHYKQSYVFSRIEDFRVVDIHVWDQVSDQTFEMRGIYNIREKRELTALEFFGGSYDQLVLETYKDSLHEYYQRAVTDRELLDLLKTARFDPVRQEFIFSRDIYFVQDNPYPQNTLRVHSTHQWWK
jgi:hypothetical protein